MAKDVSPSRARATMLSLDHKPITIEWQPTPSEDVFARLLLDLLDDDAIKDIFNEEGS